MITVHVECDGCGKSDGLTERDVAPLRIEVTLKDGMAGDTMTLLSGKKDLCEECRRKAFNLALNREGCQEFDNSFDLFEWVILQTIKKG